MKNDQFLIGSHNEYDPLKKVILTSPLYMTIKEPINDIQKQYLKENIDTKLASEQHQAFVDVLKKEGIEVVLLPAEKQFPEQVFTRDIGFTLGNHTFVAKMGHDVRKGEEHVLLNWLNEQEISFTKLNSDKIEGGDVLIDGSTIYIGVSNRTNKKSIEHIKTLLPNYEVIDIPFTDSFLHLDCVFNILSPNDALIYPGEIEKQKLELLKKRYSLIEVTKEEQATLGTNVLSIGHNKVISLPVNNRVNAELRKRGFTVIEVDITEIIKSGGAFRCCTLPLYRETPTS
ncbi:dimethylarginine dimethylaminohydrolase family protein [Niallia taxi]|uniref:dimethylarginine dimethylaminohydrolase family protein n=1 Tax=Niallia taxi TaxID=2499688 RepID=UPI00203D7630|nr:dimethylarginine dimethylaminohydrolase family protein [Niallia taxi]MCM3214331.1 dimethylarginine dimethylaminohydrolase family protein [Niallia taxi]MDK8641110.1 dimethylarginine dimethylaminohydrolase family protein [Niallia taxi]MED4038183.1 dimethylarginine dimethylaminohydrolase family protein [Niallia taxi]MED4052631.1 dimethylarginine dimethylaminohydrolase family protein [Niallia taxi]MED4119986.1 dimethylarginine dimethylaminohydrolase family protein [Niallia taxi]